MLAVVSMPLSVIALAILAIVDVWQVVIGAGLRIALAIVTIVSSI